MRVFCAVWCQNFSLELIEGMVKDESYEAWLLAIVVVGHEQTSIPKYNHRIWRVYSIADDGFHVL